MKANKLIYAVIVLIAIFLLPPARLFCQYAVQNSVLGNGGAVITDSSDFTIRGTVAIPLTGKSGNENYALQSGFWYQSAYIFSGIEDPFLTNIPKTFILYQNYPNPFNPVTSIKYGLPRASRVKIELYNILGQKVSTLLNGKKPAGYHVLKFNADHLASGMYLYTIRADYFYKVKKMILLK